MIFDWEPKEEYESKINLEEAKFILEQAEKKLKETVEISQLIVARTTSMITVSIGIMSALVGYSFTKFDPIVMKITYHSNELPLISVYYF